MNVLDRLHERRGRLFCTDCGRRRIRYFWADGPEWPTCSRCGIPAGTGMSWLVDFRRDISITRERLDRSRSRHPARFARPTPKD